MKPKLKICVMSLGVCFFGNNLAEGTVIWSDNFDSYADGQDLQGVNGWKGWDNSAANAANVSGSFSASPNNSVAITPAGPASDLVQEFSTSGTGIYSFTADTYLPTGSTGQQFFILLNTYSDGGAKNWSLQQLFNSDDGTLSNSNGLGVTTPIIFDQWVPIEVVIDLDANTQSFSYGATSLFSGESWTEGASGGGALDIGAVDLFSNGGSVMYYDNMALTSIPEPASLLLLGLGGLTVLRRRRS